MAVSKKKDPLNTPMIRQYLAIKAEVPDSILFFRMGDFYEMFLEDAQVAAPILGIALTSRNKNNPDEVPLCGFPHPQLDEYIARMVTHGFKVAICEQIEAPEMGAGGKKIFKREITRIVTPGLVTQGEKGLGAAADRARYLAAVYARGFAYLDISTGEFRVTEFHEDAVDEESKHLSQALINELARLSPSEVLCAEGPDALQSALSSYCVQQKISLTLKPNSRFNERNAKDSLAHQFGTHSLDGFGLKDFNDGLVAANAIVTYVNETQKLGAAHICQIKPYDLKQVMNLDAATRRNLELTRNSVDFSKTNSLLGMLDHCLTKQGSRLLEQWLSTPLVQQDVIVQRHDAVEVFLDAMNEGKGELDQLHALLKGFADLNRIGSRLALGTVGPRDCVALGESLGRLPALHDVLNAVYAPQLPMAKEGGTKSKLLNDIAKDFSQTLFQDLSQTIETTLSDDAPAQLKDGGFIRSGFSKELDELREIMSNTRGIICEIEAREKEKTGISSLKIKYNKVFGYFLEVTKSNLDQVPDYFIRKQTLVNAERFIVPELKEFEEKLLYAEANAQKLELSFFKTLREQLQANIKAILDVSERVAQLDVLLNFARETYDWNYVRPVLTEDIVFSLKDSRHPVIERLVKENKERFVPNDLELDAQNRQILLITGPNMAGKSTLMRQLALIVVLAQSGSFVPAKEARLGLSDGIFTRVGASDYMTLGQSTFMVEMNETANILNNATERSLVILDEIGRGTSTYDGLSIAWAVAEYLHEKIGARTLFATHYHELARLPETLSRVRNCNVAVKEWNDQIIFLRKLIDGATNQSYGIQVAKLAGLPQTVLQRSQNLLRDLEKKGQQSQLKKGKKKNRQFDLFHEEINREIHNHLEEVVNELKTVETSRMTPLEALNYIADLQTKLKGLS